MVRTNFSIKSIKNSISMRYTVTSAPSTKKQDTTIEEGIQNDPKAEVLIQTPRPLYIKRQR